MNKDLYAFAESKDIMVCHFNLEHCQSISVFQNDNYYIGIDNKKFESSKEERVHLAHEIGHCETGSFYNEHSPIDNRSKCEEQANRWAIKKLIPKGDFINQLKSGMRIFELSDYFNVTEDFIQKAYHLYCEIKAI